MPPRLQETEGTSPGVLIPRTTRNKAGEDISRALVLSNRRRKPEASTSSRALVLRNGRNGFWSHGIVDQFQKLSGQEKLALKAEEIEKTAVSPPFRFDELQRTASSQLVEWLDVVSDLHDPDLFHAHITNLIASRPRLKPELLTQSFVARTISSRIHNAYLMAASWKIVNNVLTELQEFGLEDNAVRKQLAKSLRMRDAYLLIVDTVGMLCTLAQQDLSMAVVGSNELGSFFGGQPGNKGFSTTDPAKVLAAHKSLIDAVIIELVLPESRYETHILLAVLQDALDTTPKEETKKFSQSVFDALGNLSVLDDMRNVLLGPLLTVEGRQWLNAPRKEAQGEIDEFYDAISLSVKASTQYARWQSVVFPLRRTRNKDELEEVWTRINETYIEVSGHSIDTLWRLEEDLNIQPQWSTWVIPNLAEYAEDISSDEEETKSAIPGIPGRKPKVKGALVKVKRKPGPPRSFPTKSRKQITGAEVDDDEMPALMSVSESSEDDEDEEVDDSEDDYDSGEESDWEGAEVRRIDHLLADAMREIKRNPSRFVKGGSYEEEDLENAHPNPLIRMLKSFSGRLRSTDPTFKPSKLGEKPTFGPARPPAPAPNQASGSGRGTTNVQSSKTTGVTIEDTDDEDDKSEQKKKKKKKKKKPKRKTTAEESEEIKAELDSSPIPEPVSPIAESPAPNKKGKGKAVPVNPTLGTSPIGASTATLPIITPLTAQSAHAYLQSKGEESKTKVKTRADPTEVEKNKKKGFFARFTGKNKEKQPVAVEDKPKEKMPGEGPRVGAFQLPKRASNLIGRLLGSKEDEKKGQASMRWDQFVKTMKLMGFTVNKSSQGSRVRFDPPDPKDTPLTFHKPHPDPTINPVLLKKIGKDLKKHYGWAADYFAAELKVDATYFDDDLD